MDTGLTRIARRWAFQARQKGAKGLLLANENVSFTNKDRFYKKRIWNDYLFLLPPLASNFIGYGKNSGGFSAAACYGIIPDVPLYTLSAANTLRGMTPMGVRVFTDAACTLPVSSSSNWWSFSERGSAAVRAIQIRDTDSAIINWGTRDGFVPVDGFISAVGGDCAATTFNVAWGMSDDYPEWYVGKGTIPNRLNPFQYWVNNGQYAISKLWNGPAIGRITMVDNVGNVIAGTFTSIESCGFLSLDPMGRMGFFGF